MLNQAEWSQVSLPVVLQGWELILLFFKCRTPLRQLQLSSFRLCCSITLHQFFLGNNSHLSCALSTRSSFPGGASRADPLYAAQSAEAGATNISLLSDLIAEGLHGTKSLFPFLLRSVTKPQCRVETKPTRPIKNKKDSDTSSFNFINYM